MVPPSNCPEPDKAVTCEHRFTVLETKLDGIQDTLNGMLESHKTFWERVWQFSQLVIAAVLGAVATLFGSGK